MHDGPLWRGEKIWYSDHLLLTILGEISISKIFLLADRHHQAADARPTLGLAWYHLCSLCGKKAISRRIVGQGKLMVRKVIKIKITIKKLILLVKFYKMLLFYFLI